MGVRRALEASFTSVYLANQEEILGPDLGKKKKPPFPFLRISRYQIGWCWKHQKGSGVEAQSQ